MYKEMISELTPVYGRGEAAAMVRMVMEERFGLTMTDVLLGRDESLTEGEACELRAIVSRLVAGEPVQQVLGYADFCGHRFGVTPDVLIPRPETEELVEWVREWGVGSRMKNGNEDKVKNVLDLGTGSGCIAITLALSQRDACITAVDVSAAALVVARENAVRLGADNVRFVQADMLLNLQFDHLQFDHLAVDEGGEPRKSAREMHRNDMPQRCCSIENGSDGVEFDVIVSNPPYVMRSEAATMHDNVLSHEPASALFVPDEDPLVFYRAIVGIAQGCLLPGGCVFVELNSALAEDTAALFRGAGFSDVELRRDVFGRWRMLRAGGLRARLQVG